MASAVISSPAQTAAARTHCAEGHELQAQALQDTLAGRCEDCKRWVFGKEKVMSCSCCSCYYCSACAPQASGNDDRLWEDVLTTLGCALREVENLKDTVSVELSNVSVDLQRIQSAFNCQAPGSETLSAEQIVVEHAFEQAKTVMSCGAPMDLDSQEEVVDFRHGPPGSDDVPRAGGYGSIREEEAFPGADVVPETPHEPEEQIAKAPTDLLDLSVASPGSGSPMGLMSLSPVKAAAMEPMVITSSPEKAPTDLLDLSLLDEADEVVPAVPQKAPMDLMDLPEVSLIPGKVEPVNQVVPDLMDLSFQPVAATLEKEKDIVDVKDAPMASPAVHDLADLLDFSPKAQAA